VYKHVDKPADKPAEKPQPPPYASHSGSASKDSHAGLSAVQAAAQAEKNSRAQRKIELQGEVTVKLQKALQGFNKETTSQIDKLFDTQRMLKEGEEKIDKCVVGMKQDQVRIKAALESVTSKTAEIRKWLEENENKSTIDPDKAVFFRDTWAQQMFEQVALDHAIEDTIYALDRALQDDRIDLKTFLKQIRQLARKQFFARALAQRIHEKQMASQQVLNSQAQPHGFVNMNVNLNMSVGMQPMSGLMGVPMMH
jgi:ESCRT-I complex subunit TSG101